MAHASTAAADLVRVMVVDDNPGHRDLVRGVVDGTAGFAATAWAESGEEALRRLERSCADLVLMDIRMPGAGGVAAARAAARLPERPVVVLLSAEDRPDIEADPPAHGAAAFIRKDTFSPRMLRRVWALHSRVRQ